MTNEPIGTTYVVQRDGETYYTIAERYLKQSLPDPGARPAVEDVRYLTAWLGAINGPGHCLRPGQKIFFSRPHECVKD